MAYVSTFVYCEDTQQHVIPNNKGQKVNLIGPIQILTPIFIPSMFSFSICFGILDFDISVSHKLKILFKSPKEEEKPIVDTGNMNIPIQQQDSRLPSNMQGPMMTLNFKNLALKYEGEYRTEIYLDDELLGKYPIKVKAVDPNE